MLSAGLGSSQAEWQQRSVNEVMQRRADLVAAAVSAETGRYVDMPRTVAGTLGTFEQFSAVQFAQVAAPLKQANLAGATSLSYLVPAGDSQVPQTQATWRARGATHLVLHPHPAATEHIFAVLSHPLDDSTSSVTGADITQAAAPTAALAHARSTGQVSVSEAYRLIRDQNLPPAERRLSFVLTAPVYTPGTGDHRVFRGWVVLGLRGQAFVGAVLDQVSQGLFDITLVAATDTVPSVVATLHATGPGLRDLRRHVDVDVAQRRWRLTIDAASTDILAGTGSPATTTTIGVVLSVLLAGLVLVLATGRARARLAVTAATAQLRQQQADLTTFAGIVAHDLKTPVASIRGYTEMIQDALTGTTTDDRVHTMLDRVASAATRMNTLINDLHTHASTATTELHLQDVDLHATADRAAITPLDHAGATGAPLPVFYVGELPAVHADAGMLRQLINRLVSHAVKSTPPAQTPRIEITAETTDNGLVHVHVAERGTSLPADDHDTVFTDVHRTGYGSAGLDLAICQRIVERHGGTITAATNPGGGTRITFTLAAALAVPAEPPLALPINVTRPVADTHGR